MDGIILHNSKVWSCRRSLLSVIFFVYYLTLSGQYTIYQDIFQGGGVVGDGYSPGSTGGVFLGSFDVNSIPAGSSIKQAYLFAGRHGLAIDLPVLFNGDNYLFSYDNQITPTFESSVYGGASGVHVIDVSNSVNITNTNYEISTTQFQLSADNRYTDFYLLIVYENLALSPISVSINLNDKDFSPLVVYNLSDLNPIFNVNDVGIAFYTGYICDVLSDGEYIFVEGNNIGLIGGADNGSNYCGGPVGSFFYENNFLTALNDDIASADVSESDALANIQAYLNNLTTSINITFSTQTPNNYTNSIWGLILSHTTPCDIFQTDLIVEDTTICPGEPLQLGASGGINYDWLPQTGLSCYDCPNPEFIGDSSMVYTVRIWSTDSCSKVLPVRVKVLPQPEFSSINLTSSACGEENGTIVATASNGTAPYHYQLDGGANVGNGQFSGLASSNYTLTLTDNNGCSADSTVFIDEEILVNASFTVEPPTGSAPLWVQSTNASTNATDYYWEWDDGSSIETHPGFILDTSGTYTVTLIAYNNDPACADTFSVQISVYDSLQVIIPNVFTANNDHSNDFFGITTNVLTSGTVVIFNRWGNLIMEKDFTTQPHVFEPFWDGMLFGGEKATEGVYFYQLELRTENQQESYHGFVTLVR